MLLRALTTLRQFPLSHMSQFTPAPAAASAASQQTARAPGGPTRPPQSRNGNGKRQGEDSDERPSKRPEAEQQQQQQQQRQQGGGRGGMRGGRGGFGGGRGGGQQQQQRPPQPQQQQTPRQPQQQSQQQPQQAFMQSIPHPQQQQQRPQSAAPSHGQQRNGGGGRGGRGGHQNGGQRPPQQQRHQEPADMDMSPEVPVAAPTSAASSVQAAGALAPVIESFKSDQTFRSLRLSPMTQRALDEDFKYSVMSVVQAACIPKALQGVDIVAKAKTGTGKTLAFLIPVIERVLANRATLPPAVGGHKPIRALVISPTRELAQQIEEEATRLGKFHGIRLACAVGGLAIGKDVRALQNGVDLLIATPGRLKDLMQNHGAIGQQLQSMVMLVLDEADRLLDMGFKPDLDQIFAMLPRASSRQTQLFSATFPADVAEMTSRALKANHEIVNTVGDEDDQTHQHVVQESVIIPLAQQFEALYELIAQHKAKNPKYKIIVFFTTARVASFCSRLFNQANCPTLELHSRLSQSKRTKTSEQFRDGSKMVLFSSDVSARGLDFPGVSLIIQIGLTAKDQYVHRLGRTARAGNEGHGIIMLAPFERRFLNTLTPDLPIVPLALPAGSVLATLANGQTPVYPASMQKNGFPHPLAYALSLVEDGSSGSSSDSAEDTLKGEAESAYRAWLGFYNGNLRTCGWDKAALVAQANAWSAMIGLREIPTIEAKTIGKMGLKGTPGLRIGQSTGGGGRGGNGGGRGGGQQGGGGRGGYGGGQGQGRPSSARY